MNEKIQALENERKKIYRLDLISKITAVLLIALGVLVWVLWEWSILFVLAVIVAIILFGVVTPKKKKFLKNFKETIIISMIGEELGETAVYQQSGGIALNELLRLGIYQAPDRHHMEDFISAHYNGIPYELCDARFEERHVTYDSKGNPSESYVTYFSGRILKIDFKRNFSVMLKIIEGNPPGLSTKGLTSVETEVIDFNKKFRTYADSKEKAFYFLTPVLIQKMQELEKMFKGTIQYCLNGDCFYVFINNSTDSLDVSLSRPISDKLLQILRSQITLGAAVINEFGLDDAKFNENINI